MGRRRHNKMKSARFTCMDTTHLDALPCGPYAITRLFTKDIVTTFADLIEVVYGYDYIEINLRLSGLDTEQYRDRLNSVVRYLNGKGGYMYARRI